jgi:hypothetical protein
MSVTANKTCARHRAEVVLFADGDTASSHETGGAVLFADGDAGRRATASRRVMVVHADTDR